MYGVIHKSLKDMVLEHHGEQCWQRIVDRAGVAADSFLAMQSYEDEVTYKLAQSTADELGVSLDDALRVFGRHWIERTLLRQYDTLARAAGDNLADFLENLNALHDRISSTFLDYKPPEFHVVRKPDGELEVLYVSQREGMTPFVEGLFHGLATRFDEAIDVLSIEPLPVQAGEKTRFLLRTG